MPTRSSVRTPFAHVAAVLVLAVVALRAPAQTTDIDETFVTLTSEATLHSGASGQWYGVATLPSGMVVRADGVEATWYRVQYPLGTPAVVLVEAARRLPDVGPDEGGVVELTRGTKLLAYHADQPRMESIFKQLPGDPAERGLRLRYLGDIRDNTGDVVAYQVAAPPTARGYVRREVTRPASLAEIERWRTARAASERRVIDEPDPTDADSAQAADDAAPDPPRTDREDATPPTEATSPATDADTPADPVPAEPGVETDADADTETDAEPDADPPVQPTIAASPETPVVTMGDEDAADGAAEGEETPTQRVERATALVERLDAAYEDVLRQPVEQAEIAPLISEYQRLRGLVEGTWAEETVDPYAQARIELLRLRQELQDRLAEVDRLRGELREVENTFDEVDRAIAEGGTYLAVGRLAPSVVYDGRRLPLMYRLLSIDGQGGRTIAYLTPKPELGLDGKLRAIVGVNGAKRPNISSQIPVIDATRVQILREADPRPEGEPPAGT